MPANHKTILDDSFLVERERQATGGRGDDSALDSELVSLLVRDARKADPAAAAAAFAKLARRFWTGLLQICGKYFPNEAEDLAQEVWLKIWTLRERLDPEGNFEHFLKVVAKNHCLDQIKKAATKGPLAPQQMIAGDKDDLLSFIPDPVGSSEQDRFQLRDALKAALFHLTPLQRLVVERENTGLTVSEIAQELECTTVNVRYHRHQAFDRLRELLAAEGLKSL